MIKPCECKLAGWCERHKLDKTDSMFKRCQSDDKYRKVLDNGTNNPIKPIEPSLIQKATSFVKALVKHAASGFARVSDEDLKRRLQICSDCEFNNKDSGTCTICGCLLSMKATWKSEQCPEGKWPSLIQPNHIDKSGCGCG